MSTLERYVVTIDGARTDVSVVSHPDVGAIASWSDGGIGRRIAAGFGSNDDSRRKAAATNAAISILRGILDKAWDSETMPALNVTVEKMP